jgi:ribonuclease-3
MKRNLVISSNMEDLKNLEKILKIKFKDISLLDTAVTHRSYLNENADGAKTNNERLEFLGDAVLELITSEYLFSEYPDREEGDLTSFRAATVRTTTLAETSRELGFGKYLKMSKGEEESGGKDKDYLLANLFEAILGAIYLDKGYSACKEYIYRVLIPKVGKIVEERLDIDPKTKLQELTQSMFKETPMYEVIKEEGPDHDKLFTVQAKIASKDLGIGQGTSKQKAEEEAARESLQVLEY